MGSSVQYPASAVSIRRKKNSQRLLRPRRIVRPKRCLPHSAWVTIQRVFDCSTNRLSSLRDRNHDPTTLTAYFRSSILCATDAAELMAPPSLGATAYSR